MMSCQEDYAQDIKVIPILSEDRNAWKEVNSVVIDWCEAFSQGHLVRKVS